MAQHYLLGFTILLTCFFLEAASRPSNNESTTSFTVEVPIEDIVVEDESQARSLPSEETTFEPRVENTKEILDKIKEINERLKKPHRQQINYNTPPYANGGYVLDKAILEKIQQVIESGKLHGLPNAHKEQENNLLTSEREDDESREGNSRALSFIPPELTSNSLSGQPPTMPLPYVTSIPVVVMPDLNGLTGYPTTNYLNSLQYSTGQYSTRQRPSLPFQIQWPLAPFFPVLLKDPLLHYLQGGTWQNLVEYGQNADVCNRKQKSNDVDSSDNEEVTQENEEVQENEDNIYLKPLNVFNSRQGRARKLKKRTISKSTKLQDLNDLKGFQNIFPLKPVSTPKPVTKKPVKKAETYMNTKDAADEGDLRMPFSDFTWFGNRKPVAPSPGFFINRLKVRRGGVAIAGPGGVATAGKGGTAIVGPGGLAYTQPGGLAVAGPAARIVALSPDTDLNSVVTRLQEQSSIDDTTTDGEDGETGEGSEGRAGTRKTNTITTATN